MSDQSDSQPITNRVKNWSDGWSLRPNIDKCKKVSNYFNKYANTVGPLDAA